MNNQDRLLLQYIAHYWREQETAPTLREMMLAVSYSSTSVTDARLRQLEHDGLITRVANVARSIRLTPAARTLLATAPVFRSITLTLPFPPSLNHLYLRSGRRVMKTDAARAFEQEVQIIGRDCTPLEGDVAMTIHLFRPRRQGDADNYNKALLDALQGIAYTNDKQIVELHIFLRDDDAKAPRAEIEVKELCDAAV